MVGSSQIHPQEIAISADQLQEIAISVDQPREIAIAADQPREIAISVDQLTSPHMTAAAEPAIRAAGGVGGSGWKPVVMWAMRCAAAGPRD